MPPRFSVICLAGPTGAGKTALALNLARELGCEIINADSRQVYGDFPLITAQPQGAELACAPHHLYGFLPSQSKISAGQWLALATAKMREITNRQKIPLFVGGTGFYFEALLRGLAPMPEVPAAIHREFTEKMAALGPEKLHAQLTGIDPAYAARIHPHDRQRIQRALEVESASGKTFSFWHQQGRIAPIACGPLLVLNANLTWLAPRLKSRIETMLLAGAINEAKTALKKCDNLQAPGWSGIGCRQLAAYLTGEFDLEVCKQLWLASTRAYAKRQLTWFRGRGEALFIDPASQEAVFQALAQWRHLKAG